MCLVFQLHYSILLYGIIVTILTKLVLPQQYDMFGILHFIGLTIILMAFIIEKKIIIYLVFLICLSLYGSFNLKQPNLLNYILGTNSGYHSWTID